MQDVADLANEVLITKDGKTDMDNVAKLKSKGFKVEPGETDSFGWLTGIIHTSKGKFMFG